MITGPIRCTPTVLLVGAGHAHLHVLRHADVLRRSGVRLVLIAPAGFDYSGLATGVLSGALPSGANHIDIARLASLHGIEHHVGEASAVNVPDRTVRLAGGASIPFDILSLNVGSVVDDPSGLASSSDVYPVKPLSELTELRRQIETVAAARNACPVVVVAGAGPSACEVSAAMAGLCERLVIASRVTVVGAAADTDWAPRVAHRTLVRRLARRGVTFLDGVVVERTPGACRLEGGHEIACDILVVATGLRGGALAAGSGLPMNEKGRLIVNNTLCSIGADNVFAVGDCSVIAGDERPALGVFGVRAGPVLLHNLCAAARGGALRAYRPQRRWLSVLDLGDGTGLAVRGGFWWLGRLPLRLKRWLDRCFLDRHRPNGSAQADARPRSGNVF